MVGGKRCKKIGPHSDDWEAVLIYPLDSLHEGWNRLPFHARKARTTGLTRPLSKGHYIGISCSHRFIAKITERGVRLIDGQKMKAFQGKAGSDRVPLVEAAGLNAISV